MELREFKKKYRTFQGVPVFVTWLGSRLWLDNIILINKRFIQTFREEEIRFILWHEKGHRVNMGFWKALFFPMSIKEDEIRAQKYAVKQMIKEGHNFNDLFCFELNYRIWDKFKVSIKEYIKLMKT